MTETPQILLSHYLKTLKLPTFLKEYGKVAQQCAVEGVDYENPGDEQMNAFADLMSAKGIMVIKRWGRGRSVSAGCGQLGAHI